MVVSVRKKMNVNLIDGCLKATEKNAYLWAFGVAHISRLNFSANAVININQEMTEKIHKGT